MSSVAWLPLISRCLVAIGWAGFFVFFFMRATGRKDTSARETKRDRSSVLGIVIQMVAISLTWMLQRHLPTAGVPLSAGEITLDLLAPVLSLASAWIGLSAASTLGRQWSYAARLVEGHALVTEGPYRLVRHPIYTAMLGKLLAANFAFGHWLGLVIALPLFLVGTSIRVRSEERLLRSQFGTEYDDYAKRVPAFVPFVR